MKFELKQNRRNVTSEELLQDIKTVAQMIGTEKVTSEQYAAHGKFHVTTITRRFGGWMKAIEQAGLQQSRTKMNIPNEELFENLANVWRRLGNQPTYNQVVKPLSKFSSGTYEKRFGSWNKALEKFIEYINGDESIDSDTQELNKGIGKHSYRKTPRNINWRLRAGILIRDNCICKMCGASPAKNPDVDLHVDHIIPYSKGGETLEENLRTLCSQCNIGKSDMIFDSAEKP